MIAIALARLVHSVYLAHSVFCQMLWDNRADLPDWFYGVGRPDRADWSDWTYRTDRPDRRGLNYTRTDRTNRAGWGNRSHWSDRG